MRRPDFAVFALLAVAVPATAAPGRLTETVQTTDGSVRGSPRADGVLAFKGIPYARPPVGDLRWQPPQPPEAISGILDATRFGSRCWSTLMEEGLGDGGSKVGPQSEDCLTLNIWTTATTATEKRPVMVWIHGGGFQFGTSRNPKTDGSVLAGKGVVVVSLNYRLGVMGFFAHPKLRDADGPAGNFGLQDQIAALRWVQANIARFGGDPANVTVFGESAGSASVSLLMSSPLAKGLFARAIGESGSSFSEIPMVSEIGIRGMAFAGGLGALGPDPIAQLRALPAERINSAAAWDFRGGAPFIFTAGVDGRVIPARPAEIFRAGRQNDVPLLAGYNKREDYVFLAQALPHRDAAQFRTAAAKTFGPRAPALLALYPADTDAAAKTSAEALVGDLLIRGPVWRWLDGQAQTGKAAVYGYTWAFESAYSPTASHVAEISYIFGNFVPQFFAPDAPAAGPADRAHAAMMVGYWVNFARTGNPNGLGLPNWPAFRPASAMLRIDEAGRTSASADANSARFRLFGGPR